MVYKKCHILCYAIFIIAVPAEGRKGGGAGIGMRTVFMKYDYVIIGGGIAGTTAAETIREHDHAASILIIASESHPLYSRVLLPNYIKERIVREQVFLRKNTDYDEKNISVFFGEEAGALNVAKKEILLKNGSRISYAKLLLAMGGAPLPWIVHGRELGVVYRMQTLEDADAILRDIKTATSAVVVGGGFIALEFLQAFSFHKVPVALVCRDVGIFGDALDEVGHRLLRRAFDKYHVALACDDEPIALLAADEKKPRRMLTRMNRELPFDMIGVGIGVGRNMDFARGAGIETGASGIITNEYLETNEEGVFAAGDVAEYYDIIFEKHLGSGNWTNAFLQGKIAGLNMVGQKTPYRNISAYSIQCLGLHITQIGMMPQGVEGITAVSRVDEKDSRYERFFLQEERIIGAVIINLFKDRPVIGRLIEGKVRVGAHVSELRMMDFDLNSLLG